MLIATAGHIDHGKTALIRALTGVETDRLPEEKARGISIDLGFAYWRPVGTRTIGFIDVPGHERFVRNMIAGLGGIDHALLVIAADDGIMPQTLEHLRILGLLGVPGAKVALTKSDRVARGRIAEVHADIAGLLAGTAFANAPVFAVSSLTGEGIPALAEALIAAGSAALPDEDHGFRLAIDRAFTVAGSGTVVTGTVIAGSAAVGDMLTVAPCGHEVRVRGMQSAGDRVEAVGPGSRCALNLAGIEHGELHRGDWLIAPAHLAPTSRIEVWLELAAELPAGLRHDSQVHFHHGTADIGARALVPGQRIVAPGKQALVRLVLDEPTQAVTGDRFVLRDQSGRVLIGGGVVLDPLATDRRRRLVESELRTAALALPDPAARLAALADAPGIEPDTVWFAHCCNLTSAALARMLAEGSYVMVGKDRTLAIAPQRFARQGDALLAALAQHHRDCPGEGGMPRHMARTMLGEAVSADLFATLIKDLSSAGRVDTSGALLRLPGHAARFSPMETEFWRKAVAALEDAAPRAIVIADLARELRTSEAAVTAMLTRRRVSGDVWQVTETKFMLRDHVARLAALAAGLDPPGSAGFTAADFRDASGIGRNFVIQLLEFFDRIGVTRRLGEQRRMRAEWESVVGSARF